MAKEDSEAIEMVNTSQFDIEQGPSDSIEASLLRSKINQLASPSRGRFSLGGKKKKLAIVLAFVISLWIAGTMVFISGGADGVIDYYKSKIGTISDSAPEVAGEQNDSDNDAPVKDTQEINYDDNDEPVVDPNHQADDSKKVDQDTEAEPKLPAKAQERSRIGMRDLGYLRVYSFPAYFLHPPATSTSEKDEGLYYYAERDNFVARKVSDPEYSKLLLEQFTFTYDDQEYKLATFSPNHDMTWAILSTDKESVYRHSSLSYYWFFDMTEKTVVPIMTTDDGAIQKISYAKWSPNYNYVSIVLNNDLYIKPIGGGAVERVTSDGAERLLNAKPDWVYEEEVLATEDALWWSPDEKRVAFLKTSEEDVPEYNIDYYVQTSEGGATRYPVSKKVIYPKPGFKNPVVSVHVYDITEKTTTEVPRTDSKLGDEWVLYEAFWVDKDSLLLKETDRESNLLNVRLFNPQSEQSKIVHEVNAKKGYNGWIEKFNAPLLIPASSEDGTNGYVDTYVVDGYNHLVYFSSADAKPVPLTKGNWEVTGSPLGYDADKKLVYFHASKAPIDQHIYSVHLETKEITALTDDTISGFNTAAFSPNAKFAYLTQQKALEMESSGIVDMEDLKMKVPLTSSTLWLSSKTRFLYPTKKFHRVDVDKYDDGSPVTLDVLEILPPNFDEKKKYPLLVHYYAGPGSHTAKSDMGIDFKDAVSSSLEAVVLYIEPRGTGGAGWKHRSWANKNIGYWEPRDIVSVTKKWIEKGFIDTDKTACWGWSYGGFTTLKTLEYDKGETFKYGMAVAPVTNWLLYDSIYTERYMDEPENNKDGYEVSQIKDVEALGSVRRFLLMHGTADDNVHVQNTYSLLDMLNMKTIENYDVHVFPDSEHSILYHNANPVVYDKLFKWLKDAFEGDYDKIGHK